MLPKNLVAQGAEARVFEQDGRIVKHRVAKSYRLAALDEKIRFQRTRREAKILRKLHGVIAVPTVLEEKADTLVLEKTPGVCLRDALNEKNLEALGHSVGKMHAAGVVHGDLTPSNVLVEEKTGKNNVVLVDFGLAFSSHKAEDFAADVHVLEELAPDRLFEAFWKGYATAQPKATDVWNRLEKLRRRGRYRNG